MPASLDCDPSHSRRFWLMKTEPSECSIDDALAAPDHKVSWFGIRNYQARNFIRDDMSIGDGVLFYHSSCAAPGIIGLAKIASSAYPDACQFDAKSIYFDPKSSPSSPRWLAVDVEALCRLQEPIGLPLLRAEPALADMPVLRRGNRLSITPVTPEQFFFIVRRWFGEDGRSLLTAFDAEPLS